MYTQDYDSSFTNTFRTFNLLLFRIFIMNGLNNGQSCSAIVH